MKKTISTTLVVKHFEALYEKALSDDDTEKPLSWALYQTWKWCDDIEGDAINGGSMKMKRKVLRDFGYNI